jgi:hypothetical protein
VLPLPGDGSWQCSFLDLAIHPYSRPQFLRSTSSCLFPILFSLPHFFLLSRLTHFHLLLLLAHRNVLHSRWYIITIAACAAYHGPKIYPGKFSAVCCFRICLALPNPYKVLGFVGKHLHVPDDIDAMKFVQDELGLQLPKMTRRESTCANPEGFNIIGVLQPSYLSSLKTILDLMTNVYGHIDDFNRKFIDLRQDLDDQRRELDEHKQQSASLHRSYKQMRLQMLTDACQRTKSFDRQLRNEFAHGASIVYDARLINSQNHLSNEELTNLRHGFKRIYRIDLDEFQDLYINKNAPGRITNSLDMQVNIERLHHWQNASRDTIFTLEILCNDIIHNWFEAKFNYNDKLDTLCRDLEKEYGNAFLVLSRK